MPADRREDEERRALSGLLDLTILGKALVQLNASSTGPLGHVHRVEKHAAGRRRSRRSVPGDRSRVVVTRWWLVSPARVLTRLVCPE
jgi:hypothetical protein